MNLSAPLSAALAQRSAESFEALRAGPEAPTASSHRLLPDISRAEMPTGSPRSVRRHLTRAVAWGLAAAIPTVIVIGTAVEPDANGPEPVAPLWVDLLATVTILAALAAIVALVAVRRAGVWLAAVTGGGLVALTVTCPMSGHHIVGPYTYTQLALSSGLLAASVLILATRGPAVAPAGSDRSRPLSSAGTDRTGRPG